MPFLYICIVENLELHLSALFEAAFYFKCKMSLKCEQSCKHQRSNALERALERRSIKKINYNVEIMLYIFRCGIIYLHCTWLRVLCLSSLSCFVLAMSVVSASDCNLRHCLFNGTLKYALLQLMMQDVLGFDLISSIAWRISCLWRCRLSSCESVNRVQLTLQHAWGKEFNEN